MERFGLKENVMSGEKNEMYILTGFLCSISEVLSYRVREPVSATEMISDIVCSA